MMYDKFEDFTANFGPLFPINSEDENFPKVPMFSYEKPASYFWHGVANYMRELGWNDEEIKLWLQSKLPRYMFDGSWSREIAELGYKLASMNICSEDLRRLKK